MREIKFRQPIFLNDKCHKWHYWGFVDGEFIGVVPPLKEAQRTSQQYTGLKDKNGVEIYEGDIVISRDESLVVVWVDCTARFALKSPDYEAEWSVDNGRCRVIGNIYENPIS